MIERTKSLVIDVESGSVGVAVVSSTAGVGSVEFSNRILFPFSSKKRSAEELISQTLQSTRAILSRLGAHAGGVEHVLVVYHAPWSNKSSEAPYAWAPRSLCGPLLAILTQYVGAVPVTQTSSSTVAATITKGILPHTQHLIHSLTGEQSETILTHEGKVMAHATSPNGTNFIHRSLATHAGLSEHQARSALGSNASHLIEAFSSIAHHFIDELSTLSRSFSLTELPRDLIVIAPEPYGQWLAKSLSQSQLLTSIKHFEDGTIRALRPLHFATALQTTAPRDVFLNLAATYEAVRAYA